MMTKTKKPKAKQLVKHPILPDPARKQYLVLLVHTMDDLPVYLCDNLNAAWDFANALKPNPTKKMRDVFDTDCNTPVCVKIVAFVGNVPVESAMIVSFDT
jgi:hypothetical protein